MKETQKTIKQWADDTFGLPDPPPSTRKYLRLLEEVVELCIAGGATYQEIRDIVYKIIPVSNIYNPNEKINPQPDKIPSELADCEIVLRYLAEMNDIDLNDEVDIKMRINRSRKWTKTGGGCGQHIKDEV